MRVLLSREGQDDFEDLPATMKARVLKVIERLSQWPEVSGAKRLKHDWTGHYRIRTGDWRVVFQVIAPDLIVVRIQHRSQVYEE